MAYAITHNCIGCQRCLAACPTGAIQTNGSTFWIDVNRCNQCQGTYSVPQCWAACPTNEGCIPLTAGAPSVALTSGSETSTDYWESWFATYTRLVARLQASKQSSYWRQWFDTYAQALRHLQAQSGQEANVPLLP
ncbi:MAG: 4Fe-4S binding protein [Almyronema sp.]